MDDAVSPDMRALIRDKIAEIEHQHGVTILLAVESGSRAWGFHSPDSDYDVRFIYTRPKAWHYKLGRKRDVIEYPIDDELDLSGWELRKALELTMGSNAVIAEWLQSPICYKVDEVAHAQLKTFAAQALTQKSVSWHYLSLAQRQLDRLMDADGQVRLKRFFYILRPVLALRWMRLNGAGMPPMNMEALRLGCALSVQETTAIDTLTVQKKAARERATTATRDAVLDQMIETEMAMTRAWLKEADTPDTKMLWDSAHALHLKLSP